jgi:surface protein
MPIQDVPLELLALILDRVDYDLDAAQALLRVNKRFYGAMLDQGRLARLVVEMLLTRVLAPHTPPRYDPRFDHDNPTWRMPRAHLQLNVDRILELFARGGALRAEVLRIARSTGTLHDAMLVRAPFFKSRERDAAARELLAILRPSIVMAIRSERVGIRRVYEGLTDDEMDGVVDGIGRFAFTNRFHRNDEMYPAFRRTIRQYILESALPLGERAVLAKCGPMCFWDTSGVQDMRHAFAYRGAGTPAETRSLWADFSADLMWPTQNVIDMSFAFAFSGFNGRIGHLNVASVCSMSGTFCHNDAFDQPIGSWDVHRVDDMYGMFFEARAFNHPIGNWDVRNVTTMGSMFKGARSFSCSLVGWDMRNVWARSEMLVDSPIEHETDRLRQPVRI